MSIYGWEGYLFSGGVTAVGLGFLMILKTPSYIKNSYLQRLVVFALLGAIWYGFESVVGMYKMKFKSYGPKFEPRSDFAKGSLL